MATCKHGKSPTACFDCKDEIIQTVSDAHVASAELAIERALQIKDILIIFREFTNAKDDTPRLAAARGFAEIVKLRTKVADLEEERDAAISMAQRWTRRALSAERDEASMRRWADSARPAKRKGFPREAPPPPPRPQPPEAKDTRGPTDG